MVTIPRVNRIQSSNTSTSQRIQGQAPNTTGIITQRTQGLSQLGNRAADMYQNAENAKIKQISDKAELDLSAWEQSKLQELKSLKGDPTEAYNTFEKERAEKYSSYLENYSNASERVRRHVQGNIESMRAKRQLKIDYQRGAQVKTYENNLYNSTLDLKRNELADNAGYIQVNESTGKLDIGSQAYFMNNITEIKDTVAKYALNDGTAEVVTKDDAFTHKFKNEEGEDVYVKFSSLAKRKASETISEGVSNSIDVLISSGEVEKARLMKEQYADFLTPKSEISLNNKLNKEDTKNEANSFYRDIQYMSDSEQKQKIDSINDPEKRIEVMKIRETFKNYKEKEIKRQQDMNNETLVKHVISKDWNGAAELEADPIFKRTFDKLSSKQQKAVMKLAVPPSKSNPKVILKATETLLDAEKVKNMTAEQFYNSLAGMSTTHINQKMNQFRSIKQGGGQAFVLGNRASKMLENSLYAEGLIERNNFNRLENEDVQKLSRAKEGLIEFLSHKGLDKSTTPEEIQRYVKDYIETEKTQKLFGRSSTSFWNWGSSDDSTPAESVNTAAPVPTRSNAVESLDNTAKVKLKLQYKREMNTTEFPNDNDPAFQDFVRKNI